MLVHFAGSSRATGPPKASFDDVCTSESSPSPSLSGPASPQAARNEARKDAAADRTALQALLVAARAEAERGQEANCVDTMKKARELLERSK